MKSNQLLRGSLREHSAVLCAKTLWFSAFKSILTAEGRKEGAENRRESSTGTTHKHKKPDN